MELTAGEIRERKDTAIKCIQKEAQRGGKKIFLKKLMYPQ